VDNWNNITNSQNRVRKKSFGGTFCFSNCHIIRLDTVGLVFLVSGKRDHLEIQQIKVVYFEIQWIQGNFGKFQVSNLLYVATWMLQLISVAQTISAEVRINYRQTAISTIKMTQFNVEVIFAESIPQTGRLRALWRCK
jgi:hypothetical protein